MEPLTLGSGSRRTHAPAPTCEQLTNEPGRLAVAHRGVGGELGVVLICIQYVYIIIYNIRIIGAQDVRVEYQGAILVRVYTKYSRVVSSRRVDLYAHPNTLRVLVVYNYGHITYNPLQCGRYHCRSMYSSLHLSLSIAYGEETAPTAFCN